MRSLYSANTQASHQTLLMLCVALLLGGGCVATRYESLPEKSLADFPSIYPEQRLQLDEEMSITYVTAGQGPAVVFLHGLGADHQQWNLTMPAVVEGRQVVALDFPGHGKSTFKIGYPYSIRKNAEATLAVMDRLKIQRAVLVGNSMGGQTALYLAIHHPDRVRALALASPVGVAQFGILERYLTRFGLWLGVVSWFDEAWLRTMVTDVMLMRNREHPICEALLRKILLQVRDDKLRAHLNYMLLTCANSLASTPTWESLDRIRVPVWGVWGDQDRLSDPHNRGLLPLHIPGARLSLYRGVGHCPPLEVPERYNRDLQAFLDRLK